MNRNFPQQKDIFLTFSRAILEASRASFENLPLAVNALKDCSGVIFTSGCGKSALVAQKLASSLATMGKKAFFLDPLSAAHGELAMLTNKDLLVLISRSGETEELVNLSLLVPSTIITITARTNSRLARCAKIVIPIGQLDDPINNLPTSTFLASCAIVDALVLCVCTQSLITGHPGGAIGKGQTQVSKVMHPPPAIYSETSMIDIISAITKFGLGAVTITDGLNNLLGLITDGDLRRAVQKKGNQVLELKAFEIATQNPVTINENETCYTALTLMEHRSSQISVLPVINDQSKLVGLVRIHDLIEIGIS